MYLRDEAKNTTAKAKMAIRDALGDIENGCIQSTVFKITPGCPVCQWSESYSFRCQITYTHTNSRVHEIFFPGAHQIVSSLFHFLGSPCSLKIINYMKYVCCVNDLSIYGRRRQSVSVIRRSSWRRDR